MCVCVRGILLCHRKFADLLSTNRGFVGGGVQPAHSNTSQGSVKAAVVEVNLDTFVFLYLLFMSFMVLSLPK